VVNCNWVRKSIGISSQRSSILSRFEWTFRWKNGKNFRLPGIYSFFWKTVLVSHTKSMGQLANSNHWITWSRGVDDQRSKYSNTLGSFQIINDNLYGNRLSMNFWPPGSYYFEQPCPWVKIFVVWLGEFVHYETKTLFRVAWHFWKNIIFIVDTMSKHRDFIVCPSSKISSAKKIIPEIAWHF